MTDSEELYVTNSFGDLESQKVVQQYIVLNSGNCAKTAGS